MALVPTPFPSNNDFYGLTGVYNGQAQDKLVFLGHKDQIRTFDGQYGDKLYFGVDNRMRPSAIRMFYDPPTGVNPDSYFGFFHIGSFSMQQNSVDPSVYSQQLIYRDKYVVNSLFGRYWLDMINPLTILNSDLFKADHYRVPFFAFNGLLANKHLKIGDFCLHPQPNGSLYCGNLTGNNNASLCASMTMPLGIDLEGPSTQGLRDFVKECLDRTMYNYANPSDSGSGKILTSDQIWMPGTIAQPLNAVWQNTFMSYLKELIFSEFPDYAGRAILWVQQYGIKPSSTGQRVYLLFKLDDPNNYYPYFCVTIQQVQQGNFSVFVYEMDSHLLEDIQAEILEYRSQSFYANIQQLNKFCLFKPSIIGDSDPFLTNDLIQFNYQTYVVEAAPDNKYYVKFKLNWDAQKTLDPEDLEYGTTVITNFNGRSYGSLDRLTDLVPTQYEAVKYAKKRPMVDEAEERPVSEELWYQVGPRLDVTFPGF